MAADAQLIVRDKIEAFAIAVYHATRRYGEPNHCQQAWLRCQHIENLRQGHGI